MRIHSIGWGILCMALVVGGCGGPPPGTGDRSTPQATVESLVHAINQHDAAAMKACFVMDIPARRQYVDAMGGMLAASGKLAHAAEEAFGDEDARQVLGNSGPGADEIRRFQDIKPAIADNVATLKDAIGEVLILQKSSQGWQVVPGATAESSAHSNEALLADATITMTRIATVLNDVAGKISSGELKTADAAREQIESRTFPPQKSASTAGIQK